MEMWTSTDSDAFTALVWLGDAIGQHGCDSPSLRKIAASRGSPGSLINWFGSKGALHRRVVRTLGVKWGRVLSATLVPLSDADWFYARLRLAYEELARSDPAVGAELDELVEHEREIIAWWIESTHEPTSLDPAFVTVLHALLMRLWDRRVQPDPRASLALLEDVITSSLGQPVIERPYIRLSH